MRMKFFQKKTVWLPTAPACGLLVALGAQFLILLGAVLYPFLARHDPLPRAEIAILEGWMGDSELAAAVADAGSHALFVTTGGPIPYGVALLPDSTFAGLTALRLRAAGVSPTQILSAPAPFTQRDRTYVSAVAACQALRAAGQLQRPINLYSVAVHSRRSGFLYRRALGGAAPLGVVSLECHSVDMRHWWRSSEAFKSVVTELISWAYLQCTRWTYGAARPICNESADDR